MPEVVYLRGVTWMLFQWGLFLTFYANITQVWKDFTETNTCLLAWGRLSFWLILCSIQMNGMGLFKIQFPVSLIPFNQKILFDDWARLLVNINEWDLLFNLISLIKYYLYWWNINKSCTKTKEQAHQILLNVSMDFVVQTR